PFRRAGASSPHAPGAAPHAQGTHLFNFKNPISDRSSRIAATLELLRPGTGRWADLITERSEIAVVLKTCRVRPPRRLTASRKRRPDRPCLEGLGNVMDAQDLYPLREAGKPGRQRPGQTLLRLLAPADATDEALARNAEQE